MISVLTVVDVEHMPVYRLIQFITMLKSQTLSSWELHVGVYGPSHMANKVTEYIERCEEEHVHIHNFFKVNDKIKELIALATYDIVCISSIYEAWHPAKLEIQAEHIIEVDACITVCDKDVNMQNVLIRKKYAHADNKPSRSLQGTKIGTPLFTLTV